MDTSYNESGNAIIEMETYEQDMIDTLFARVDMTWPKEARARFTVSRPGELVLVRSTHFAPNSSSRRLERHMNEAEGQHYFACLPLTGSLRINLLGRDCHLQSGDMGIVATDQEYEIEMSDHLDALWLRVPASILGAHVISMNQALARPLSVEKGLGFAAQQLMRGALIDGNELEGRSAQLFAQSLVSFVGETINSEVNLGTTPSNVHRQKILSRACEFIDAHIDDEELNPHSIARGVGISPRYLSEIFAAEGISPMRWVQRRRLELCRTELEKNRGAGQQLICEIAYSVGFTNVSSFNRAFKAQYGRSPGEFMASKSPVKCN
jgi:AraC-like DNA-binding protein